MPRGPIRIDVKNTPRQRHFDQRVADLLNALVVGGFVTPAPGGGWQVGGATGESAQTVLAGRVFSPKGSYGEWGG